MWARRSGYFSAREVQVVLSLLKIIDNSSQDIPLAAVLLSSIGGFTEEGDGLNPEQLRGGKSLP